MYDVEYLISIKWVVDRVFVRRQFAPKSECYQIVFQ